MWSGNEKSVILAGTEECTSGEGRRSFANKMPHGGNKRYTYGYDGKLR
jgi:hypothetical protein